MNAKLASIILAAIMVLGGFAPLSAAMVTNPELPEVAGVTTPPSTPVSVAGIPVTTAKGVSPTYAEKLDKALLDKDYLSQLVDYAPIYKSTYESISGTSIPFEPLGLIVTLTSMAELPRLESLVSQLGGIIVKKYPQIDTVVVAFPADVNAIGKASKVLAEMSFVEKVGLDRMASLKMFDTVILTGSYFLNTLGINGSGVLVAVLDTGVDPTHPSIPTPLFWRDFINNATTPYDDHGHGTHVAGTILGRGPSVFNTTTGMWHSVIVGENFAFNYPGPANFTYAINVSAFAGTNVTIEFEHFYGLDNSFYGLLWGYNATAHVYVKFDAGNWTEIATFWGNLNTSIVSKYNVTVPAGATMMYLSFVLVYDIYTFWSVPGWFINYVKVYNATNATIVVFQDNVATLTPPPELVSSYLWIRTPSNFTGVAPAADLAAGKICAAGAGCPYSAILSGMEWAFNISADVVSMSIGGPAYYYDSLAMMADWLTAMGITVVIAAGNDGWSYYTINSPGISHGAITVGAATKNYAYGYFSSSGPSPVDFYVKPDVSAPGLGIISAVPLWYAAGRLPWGAFFPYESWMGTSMATPHVSGLVALIKQANPTWTPQMIKSAIISTADWLVPSIIMPHPYDVYRQGGGMIDPIQAVTTTVLPVEANIFVGELFKGVNTTATFNITLVNLGATPVNATVTNLDLFAINFSTFPTQYFDYTNLITSPVNGTSYIIPANGNVTITVTLNLSDPTLVLAPYGGHVEFTTNTSGTIHVIFGFPLLTYIWINGTVYNYYTGDPIANANVTVNEPLLTGVIAWNVTDANGQFTVKVPSNYTVRITVNATGFYSHVGYTFATPATDVIYNVPMVPYVTVPTTLIWIEPDPTTYPTAAINATLEAAAELGLPTLIWDAAILGSPYDAVLSGDFPLVIYLSGGDYTPFGDPADYTAALYYGLFYPGTIVLSGGDIGWYLDGTTLLSRVAHAQFIDDLSPGNYTVEAYKSPITWTLFGGWVYLANYANPWGTPMGVNFTVWEIPGYYPDMVNPINGGMTLANWTGMGWSAGVWYDGTGAEVAKSVYFAFDIEQLDYELQVDLMERIFAFAFDTAAPTLATSTLAGTLYNDAVEIDITGAYQDDFYLQCYYVEIYDGATNTLITQFPLPGTTTTFMVNATQLGLPYGVYYIKVYAVDLLGNDNNGAMFTWNYLPATTSGATLTLITSGTVSTSTFAAGASVTATTTAPISVQLAELSSVTAITGSLPNVPKLEAWQLHADIYLNETVPGAAQQLVIKIQLPVKDVWLRTDKFQAFWYDGTTWRTFSHIELNTTTGVVTIYVNSTTSPSLTDLKGTPILLALPPSLVGGEIATTADSISILPILTLVAGLALAGIAITRRK